MQESFTLDYVIKFVNGDPEIVNPTVSQTGDMTAFVIAAVLAIIAIAAGVFFFVRNNKTVLQTARTTAGSYATMRGAFKPKGQVAVLILAVVAAALSVVWFANAGANKAIASDEPTTIEAQVFDDGTVNIPAMTVTNPYETTEMKIQGTTWNLTGTAKSDAEMLAANCFGASLELGGTIYEGHPDGEVFAPETPLRIEAGDSATIQLDVKGLNGATLKKFVDQDVYQISFTFEDAMVPVPTDEDAVTYDGKFHLGVLTDPENPDTEWYPECYEDSYKECYQQDVPDNAENSYVTQIELKPGFIWFDKYGHTFDEPYYTIWTIDPAPLSITTPGEEKTYDTNPLQKTSTWDKVVRGLIQERYVAPDSEEYLPECVALNDDWASVTHYYECLDESDEFVGVDNTVSLDWEAPAVEGYIQALQTNYSINIMDIHYGKLLINRADIGNVQAQSSSYKFDTLPHGDYNIEPTFIPGDNPTVEYTYFEGSTEKPLSEKKITNVAESGDVTFYINTYVKVDGVNKPGDYNLKTGTYNLTITPLDLQTDTEIVSLSELLLNGQASTVSTGPAKYDIFYFHGDTKHVNFRSSEQLKDQLIFKINTSSGAVYDSPLLNPNNDFLISQYDDQSTYTGEYQAQLISDGHEQGKANYHNSMDFNYYIHEVTEINYDTTNFNLYVDEVSVDNWIDPSDDPLRPNNPLYSDIHNIIFKFNEAPTSPSRINVAGIFDDGTDDSTTLDTQSQQFQLIIPTKIQSGHTVYPKEITVTTESFVKLSFSDTTTVPENVPNEDDLDGHFSHVTLADGSVYSNNKYYLQGTTLTHNSENTCLVTSSPAFDEDVPTQFNIILGQTTPYDTTEYITAHYDAFNYSAFSQVTITSDSVEYSLNRKASDKFVSLVYDDNTPCPVSGAYVPYAVPDAHQYSPYYDLNFTQNEKMVVGTQVSLYVTDYEEWRYSYGWDYLIDDGSGDSPLKKYSFSSNETFEIPASEYADDSIKLTIEPFIKINVVDNPSPSSLPQADFYIQFDAEAEKQYPSPVEWTYYLCVPRNTEFSQNSDNPAKIEADVERCSYYDSPDLVTKNNTHITFRVQPRSSTDYSTSWLHPTYTVDYTESPSTAEPVYTMDAQTTEITYNVTWDPNDNIKSVQIGTTGEQVYTGTLAAHYNDTIIVNALDAFEGKGATLETKTHESTPQTHYDNLLRYYAADLNFNFKMNKFDVELKIYDWHNFRISDDTEVTTPDNPLYNGAQYEVWSSNTWVPIDDPSTLFLPPIPTLTFENVSGHPQQLQISYRVSEGTMVGTSRIRSKDAAFEFDGWDFEQSHTDALHFKFKQKSNTYQLACDPTSFEDFAGDITSQGSEDGNPITYSYTYSGENGWNYAVADSAITVKATEATTVAGKNLVLKDADGAVIGSPIPFNTTSGSATFTMPAKAVTLSIEEPVTDFINMSTFSKVSMTVKFNEQTLTRELGVDEIPIHFIDGTNKLELSTGTTTDLSHCKVALNEFKVVDGKKTFTGPIGGPIAADSGATATNASFSITKPTLAEGEHLEIELLDYLVVDGIYYDFVHIPISRESGTDIPWMYNFVNGSVDSQLDREYFAIPYNFATNYVTCTTEEWTAGNLYNKITIDATSTPLCEVKYYVPAKASPGAPSFTSEAVLTLDLTEGWEGYSTICSSSQLKASIKRAHVAVSDNVDDNAGGSALDNSVDDNLDDSLNDVEGNDPEENVPALEAVAAFILRLF